MRKSTSKLRGHIIWTGADVPQVRVQLRESYLRACTKLWNGEPCSSSENVAARLATRS